MGGCIAGSRIHDDSQISTGCVGNTDVLVGIRKVIPCGSINDGLGLYYIRVLLCQKIRRNSGFRLVELIYISEVGFACSLGSCCQFIEQMRSLGSCDDLHHIDAAIVVGLHTGLLVNGLSDIIQFFDGQLLGKLYTGLFYDFFVIYHHRSITAKA